MKHTLATMLLSCAAACTSAAPSVDVASFTDDKAPIKNASSAYVVCVWAKAHPLVKYRKQQPAMDIAKTAEGQCAKEREALRLSLATENGGSKEAIDFANSYTETYQSRMHATVSSVIMQLD